MPYSQVEQVISEIRCINKTFDIDECIVKEKILEADDLINGYLGKVYEVPFRTDSLSTPIVPRIVNQISKKLATSLYVNWIFEIKTTSSVAQQNSDKIYDRYLNMLKDMVARKDAMPILFCKLRSGVGMNDEGGFDVEIVYDSDSEFLDVGWSNTQGYLPTFNEGSFINQRVDPNKLLDIEEARESVD